ncbi:terpene synthase family protein [Burkholderia pyrrocinia]|uniref:terpene synthase family protein n=1 Tax=Burkholderia pyrrocinia TaxID=60550 RepID=UPI0038B4F98C
MSAEQNVLTSGALRYGDKLYFPPIGFKSKHQQHPDFEVLRKEVDEADRPYVTAFYGSEEAAEAHRRQLIPVFGCLICPHASKERSYWFLRQMELIAIMDDHFTLPDVINNPQQLSVLEKVYGNAVDGIRPSDEYPIAQLLHDSVQPIFAMLSPASSVGCRLAAAVHEVIHYLSHPVVYQMATLSFDDYLRIRRCETTAEWSAVLIEFGINVDMEQPLAESADLREVWRAANDLIVFINDIGSFRKEFSSDEALNGVWMLVMHNKDMSVQQALNRLVELARETEDKLIAARDRVLASPLGQRDDVRRYLDELVCFYAGTAEFHTFSERFLGYDSKQPFHSGEVTIERLLFPQDIAGFSTYAQSMREMSPHREDAAQTNKISGDNDDPHQTRSLP